MFYKCPFSYFCKFGLKLNPLKKAELDFAQSGTFIHHCLEKILSENDRDTLREMPDDTLREKIQTVLENYIAEKLGGSADKEPRFLFLLHNLCDTVLDVIKRLIAEFSVSAFIPTDFELSIGPDGDIQPYRLPLSDGGSIRIIGSVDRVDVMEKDGKSYLRVIDYKSGGKNLICPKCCRVLICKCSFTCLPFVKTGKNGTAILYRRVFCISRQSRWKISFQGMPTTRRF